MLLGDISLFLLNINPQKLYSSPLEHEVIYIKGKTDKELWHLLQDVEQNVRFAADSGHLIEPSSEIERFLQTYSKPRFNFNFTECSLIKIVDWIELEQAADPDFPLKFSDEATEYIKKRNNNIKTTRDKLDNYDRVCQENSKLREEEKERDKPAQEKFFEFLLRYYVESKKLQEGAIVKNLLSDMRKSLGEDAPSERTIYIKVNGYFP